MTDTPSENQIASHACKRPRISDHYNHEEVTDRKATPRESSFTGNGRAQCWKRALDPASEA